MFTFWSGNLALDFAGTMAHRDTDRIDVIDTPDLLASWVVAAGLLDEPPAVDHEGLRRAVRLREAIYRLAVAPLRGRERAANDVAVLNESAAATPVRLVLNTGEQVSGRSESASAARVVPDSGEQAAGPLTSASSGPPPAARPGLGAGERDLAWGDAAFAMRLRHTGGLENALASVARSAAELLGGPDAARIRQCEREPCTRLYVDLSRGGTRRWCDMRECGNREKAATFRSRRRPTA